MPKTSSQRPKITPELIAKVTEMKASGGHPSQIARDLGISVPRVYNILKAPPAADTIIDVSDKPAPTTAVITLNRTALSADNHAEIGAQLTILYRDAQEAELKILRFGAAFSAVEQNLSTRGQVSGGRGNKGGFAEWLRTYAPDISRPTAIRYRDIAIGIAEKFNIIDPVAFFDADPKTLPAPEQKKREKVLEFVSEKSVRAIQLELGLTTASTEEKNFKKVQEKPQPPPQPKIPDSPVEQQKMWAEAARKRAVDAFSELHVLDDRWKLMDEKQIRLAITDAKHFVSEAEKWLKSDPATRLQCEVEKHLEGKAGK
ncbi:MAG: hypothetical protein LBV12_08795 [Puniceicoccales bacterium]|jgi:hypothetical protein|nr:hypothetical protein [Puniceicoccales bacterium]